MVPRMFDETAAVPMTLPVDEEKDSQVEEGPDVVQTGHGYSPRARGVLFTLLRPKGPIVENYAEFRNPFLKKISTELFSEIEIKQGYPLFKISHTNLTS